MNEYKNYVVVVDSKVISLVRSPFKPKANKTTEVLEITDFTFAKLAYKK